jgi:hypothetical protein
LRAIGDDIPPLELHVRDHSEQEAEKVLHGLAAPQEAWQGQIPHHHFLYTMGGNPVRAMVIDLFEQRVHQGM